MGLSWLWNREIRVHNSLICNQEICFKHLFIAVKYLYFALSRTIDERTSDKSEVYTQSITRNNASYCV